MNVRATQFRYRSGFTLIEIMMVVGLILIMFTVGIPSFVNANNQRPMRLATKNLMEALNTARAQAIIRGQVVKFRINPMEYTFNVIPTGQRTELDENVQSGSPDTKRGLFSVKFPDEIGIELLDVNFVDLKKEENAVLKFYSNGTSEEFKMVIRSLHGEYRLVTVDPITARPNYEVLADGF
jgi:prepilin-type N-terminal cleavage/methylation domain-containing protein